jgi:Secretion system C-terminal sorting domain
LYGKYSGSFLYNYFVYKYFQIHSNHKLNKSKMRAFTVLYLLLLFSCTLNAQQKPEFEFTLYGEDAKGHKDSVVIGYHKDAIKEWDIEPTFGDVGIVNRKFDTIFEMRVHKHKYIYQVLSEMVRIGNVSKHITLQYGSLRHTPQPNETCVPYGLSQYGFILVKVKYPPIKFSWDKLKFSIANNPCISQSFLIDNEAFTQEGSPEINPNYPYPPTYFVNQNFLIDSLTKRIPRGVNYKYSDGTTDTLQGNYTFIFRNYSIYRPVAVDDIKGIQVKSYPNPCNEILNINLPETLERVRVNIYSNYGALMQATHSISSTIISIDTTPLSIGNHVIEIIGNNGKRYLGKFVKQ